MPALDGIRAVAVVGVMAYHGGVAWLGGGFLGVDAFFVLSGFLITSLLVEEWHRTATIRLRSFWAGRARRLLPALVAVVLFVLGYAAFIAPRGSYPDLRGDALSTLFYVANWHFIVSGANYFAQSGLPSPLTHTWSLAIEEQFYLVWPLVVLALLRWTRSTRVLLWVCLLGAMGSAVEMALLYRAGASPTRLYYGTDTHAQSLLVGAALGVFLTMQSRRHGAGSLSVSSDRWRGAVVLGGFGGLATLAVLWTRASGASPFLFEGGFLLCGLASAAVLLSVVRVPNGVVATVLSCAPLRFVGRISYGMYLWHFPLFIVLDGTRTGLDGAPLFAVRCAATVMVASASFYLLERPIRTGRLLRRRSALVVAPAALMAVILAVVTAAGAAAAPALPPPTRMVGGTRPLKVLTIGDSVALTLGMALSVDAASYGITQTDEAILGCGVAEGTKVIESGQVDTVARPCRTGPAPPGTPQLVSTKTPFGTSVVSPDAEEWTTWYRHWVDTTDPNVVLVLAGRWEVVTRTYQGHWTNILDPAFASYVKAQLERIVQLASSRGARVVLMTAPCFDQGTQPDGQPWPTDSAARLAAYNRLVRSVAAGDPAVTVFDLDRLVCPGGTFERSIDGVTIRAADGIHFTPDGWRYLGPRIWPEIRAAAAHGSHAPEPKGAASTPRPALAHRVQS